MKKLLLLSLFLFTVLFQEAWAQNKTVSGTVTDDISKQGLPGVTVLAKGTPVGTSTDVNGNYTLSVPANATTLVFSFIGYTTIERAIGNASSINVNMGVDAKQLGEVVVVGYGTQQKRDVTGSISQVKGEEIANLATPSFDQQLAGRASGVQVQSSSGILGSPPNIRIRGVNSISTAAGGNSTPLIVIDGVPSFTGNFGTYTPANVLGDINPNDIESFEILKDGAATAIYGSRASNGVILITTKRGKAGQVKFNYDTYAGWAKATKLHNLLNAEQFVEIKNEMSRNANPTAPLPAVLGTDDTNWNDYVYRNGFQQNHSFSATAGSENTKYYVSLGFTDQEGIAVANDLRRYTLRSNLDQKVTKWMNFGIQAGLSRQENNGTLTDANSLSGNTFSVIRMLPNVAVYDKNDPTGYNLDDSNPRTLGRGANLTTIANNIPNVIFGLENNVRKATTHRIIGNTFLDFKLIDNLKFQTLGGIDLSFTDDFQFLDPRHGDGQNANGILNQIYSPTSRWNWQNILSYNKSINGMHNLDATLVAEYTKYKTSYFQASGSGISDRLYKENIISNTITNQNIYGDQEENGLSSYLARLNYNFKNKYYLGASIRADGLSKLSPENRWGYFPGASAAYRISEEDFFKGLGGVNNYISDLRIRGSYGVVGNSNIVGGNYPYLGSYGPAQYGSQAGIGFSNTGNPLLKWETQKSFDIGVDLGLLDNRFNFEFAYWKKDNDDIVLGAPTPPSLGVPSNLIYRNIGGVSNNGLEFTLSGAVLNTANLKWNTNLNFSTQHNEVTGLVNGQDIFLTTTSGIYTIMRVGEPVNAIYGYQYEGVNPANGNPLYRKGNGTLIQGNINNSTYVGYDPANPVALGAASSLSPTEDKKILGNSLPTWFGGFDNTFNYRNFDLNIFFRFSGGNKVFNRTRADLLTSLFENNSTEILGRWQSPEIPGDGVTPRLYTNRNSFTNLESEASSRFTESGNFLKLNNITLGYTLPEGISNRVNINRLRLFAQAQNIWTLTNYTGLDPENYTGIGVDYNSNPQQSVLTFGLNLGF
ncbi:SusC/RagA family TonB-linked outer membrane protein [Adhaeribacter aerolatus]|uniref:SusC/RagA family TonB-linked outer membrane protein n=1 Tax=Adhaeribacter aerolatus TaxID=670289 RepID=A0A512ASN7_9BACT|nr:TonB-dependent receptor [Adhaeribacter aerolatus]GEO02722.1 SusC/RagA family TonB-linked outer membrane protein [Adhaeribacter aerolatus]